MAKTLKTRKGPTESATKFKVGTKKKGNDDNMWIIIKTKSGTHRWKKHYSTKASNTPKKTYKKQLKIKDNKWFDQSESVWGKNIALENFWRNLSSGKKIVLIYNTNKTEIYNMPKTTAARSNKYKEFLDDPTIKILLTSPMSVDAYEYSLYPKAYNKTPKEVIDNYKKYFRAEDPNSKEYYPF